LTTIQKPGEAALTVVKLEDAGGLARLEDDELAKVMAGYVRVLHKLRYALPEDVLPTIKKAMSRPGGSAVALGRTHSIELSDLRPNLDQVFQLLKFLDAEPRTTGSETFRVFSIRNRSALELAELLNRLSGTGYLSPLQPTASEPSGLNVPQPGPDSLSLQGQPAAQGTPPGMDAMRVEQSRLIVNADEATNTLFASGDAGLIDKIAGLITTLDVMPPQVMLEVLILNLSDSDALDLGVEFRSVSDQGTAFTLSSLFGLGAPLPGVGPQPPPNLLGLTGTVLKPADFSALVHALQVLNKGRALNIPKILVNSNQRANLASVLQTPFLSTNVANVGSPRPPSVARKTPAPPSTSVPRSPRATISSSSTPSS
jgi:type II secretory pathway component GspD/PulD (secretin)